MVGQFPLQILLLLKDLNAAFVFLPPSPQPFIITKLIRSSSSGNEEKKRKGTQLWHSHCAHSFPGPVGQGPRKNNIPVAHSVEE
jgi:hypothetical protein